MSDSFLQTDIRGRLLWSLADPDSLERIPLFPARATTRSRDRFRTLLDEARRAAFTEAGALTLIGLAWTAAANTTALFAEPAELPETLDILLTIAEEASRLPYGEEPLLHQLLAGELPWVLGCCFENVKQTRKALKQAKQVLAAGLLDSYDGDGPLARPLLACWTRCLDLGVRAERLPWNNTVQKRFESLVRQSLRFLRKDGTPYFTAPYNIPFNRSFRSAAKTRPGKKSTDAAPQSFRAVRDAVDRSLAMLETAVALDRDAQDAEIALLVLPGRRTFDGRSREDVDPRILPQETCFSEETQTAVLRSGWDHEEASLAVMYGDGNVNPVSATCSPSVVPFGGWTDDSLLWELNARSRTIWSGPASLSVRVNGETLTANPDASGMEDRRNPTGGNWTVLCSEEETAYDYLELELPLTHEFRLQRHLLLLHDEELLLLADTLLPANPYREPAAPVSMEYELLFPLAETIHAATDTAADTANEATELLLAGTVSRGSKSVPLIRVFPLALPEWKTQAQAASEARTNPGGSLEIAENMLTYRLWTQGRGLFVPLLFDFSANRLNRPYTWRPLTVGENLEPVSRDRAAAFRIRFGKSRQYVLYRSLTPVANRTMIGHNMVSELLFGRFTSEGTVEPIMEVVENEE